MPLSTAMARASPIAGVLVIVMVWMGPETRGRQLQAVD